MRPVESRLPWKPSALVSWTYCCAKRPTAVSLPPESVAAWFFVHRLGSTDSHRPCAPETGLAPQGSVTPRPIGPVQLVKVLAACVLVNLFLNSGQLRARSSPVPSTRILG